jgi:hypothetical protein
VRSVSSEKVRNILLRGEPGDALPESITVAMDREQVASGVLRGGGVLDDVLLRAHGSEAPRKLAGRAHAVVIEGSVELAQVVLRAVIARETDRGLETLSGEIVSARVVSLEAHVTAFDDVPEAPARKDAPPRPVPSKEVPKPSAWSDAAIASATAATEAPAPRPAQSSPALMPPRPVRAKVEEDQPVPDAGDLVEHFAFGACDVVKVDGDRLHVRLPRDQRIKEIALEMLRVTPLPPDGDRKRWRLDRRM